MKITNYTWYLIFIFLGLSVQSYAHVGPDRKDVNQHNVQYRMDCEPSRATADLDINNVRARLHVAGDLFWDNERGGGYIVPKREPTSGIEEVSSIYAAAVWIGGVLKGDVPTLKIACQNYRSQNGADFYPGPLRDEDGKTDAQTCRDWDRLFRVRGDSVRKHLELVKLDAEGIIQYTEDMVPEDLKKWPALGNPFFAQYYDFELPNTNQGLGEFYDASPSNGFYNPLDGDYPIIGLRGCTDPIFADEMYFSVYNDNGNVHEVTGGTAIQMEVQLQSFAFKTLDELNDMTFYRYKMINRAPEPIDSTFFGMWIDPDLGCPDDDFIGCDTSQSLMYVYNEDAVDGTNECNCIIGNEIVPSYCDEVPILGIDFFQGPLSEPRWDPVTGHFRRVDLGMSSFMYYNRGGGNNDYGTEDPIEPIEYYRYLTGHWRDGSPITIGGTGYMSGGKRTKYAFPSAPNAENQWSMCEAELQAWDRRTLQASGPFRLDPGAINNLIIGIVWLQDAEYPCPSIDPLLRADRRAQAFFDGCFIDIFGPDAPTICPLELDQELVFTLVNDANTSNNYGLNYKVPDPRLSVPNVADSFYRFEGYRVFQLASANVNISQANLNDVDKAREVASFDIKNNIKTIYNWEAVQNPHENGVVWEPIKMVSGLDNGISHSFRLTQDAFASGDDIRLINFKKYYYTVIAYAHNNFQDFDPNQPSIGQREPYIVGHRNVTKYTLVPRKTTHINLNTMYGDRLPVTRLDGNGVGENFLLISDKMREEIALNGKVDEITFLSGNSPIHAQIYNPVNVKDGTYLISFEDYSGDPELKTAKFTVLKEGDVNPEFISESRLDIANEHLINNYGFSIHLGQSAEPGTVPFDDPMNGFIGASMEYADPDGVDWYRFIQEDQAPTFDFIKTDLRDQKIYGYDPNQVYTTHHQTGFYPFLLLAYDTNGIEGLNTSFNNNIFCSPGWFDVMAARIRGDYDGLENLNNVDIVFTANKELWSRCIVVQSANYGYEDLIDQGKPVKKRDNLSMDLLRRISVTKESRFDNDNVPMDDIEASGTDSIGYAYFPGYAVDVETGHRLNIFFGENTYYSPQNKSNGLGANPLFPPADTPFDIRNIDSFPLEVLRGNDRMWNPNEAGPHDRVMAGGSHYIYVTDLDYDGCRQLHDTLLQVAESDAVFKRSRKRNLYKFITWAGFPVMASGTSLTSYADGLIPNDLTIRLRVNNPFQQAVHTGNNNGFNQYRVTIEGKEATELRVDEADSRLDYINVVPNPYYGYSVYESSDNDNILKITNLPQTASVAIYSLDGKYIRSFEQNVENDSKETISNAPIPSTIYRSDIEWDLKNDKGKSIASGIYFIHIEVPGVGERVIKWFCIRRAFNQ